VRQLSKSLHQQAAQYAVDGEVCCFQLITTAQEFLQQHNTPPDEEEPQPAAPQSLWHEMLQRDMAAAAATSREQSFRMPVMGDFFDSLDGGGLFADSGDLPLPGAGPFPPMPASTLAVPVMEVRSKQAARPPKPPALHRSQSGAAEEPSVAHTSPAAPPRAADTQAAAVAGPAASAALDLEEAGGAACEASGLATQQPGDAGSPAVAEGRQGSGALPQSASGDPASSLRREDSSVSGLSGGSMLRSLGHSLRGVLPKALRRYVDGAPPPPRLPVLSARVGVLYASHASRAHRLVLPASSPAPRPVSFRPCSRLAAAPSAGGEATPESSDAGEASPAQPDDDRRLIRQELFLGHLLTLAASSGAVPPHALPSLAGALQAQGLIPKWLAFTLTQQPALFDRAFQRVFHKVPPGWLGAGWGPWGLSGCGGEGGPSPSGVHTLHPASQAALSAAPASLACSVEAAPPPGWPPAGAEGGG
jgi:translation initiation factor 2-alpha kinase 4